MADNKTKPTEVSVEAYIAALPDQQRPDDARVLVGLMQRLSGEAPRLWGPSIIGFGVHRYRYESGREGETLRIGFAPRKPALVIYGLGSVIADPAVATALGKHTTGKGCLYIKALKDIDLAVLEMAITRALDRRPDDRID